MKDFFAFDLVFRELDAAHRAVIVIPARTVCRVWLTDEAQAAQILQGFENL